MLRRMCLGVQRGGRGVPGGPRVGVDVAYIWVGIAVPVLTFIGVWIWRARMRAGHDLWDDVPGRVDEFARSVTALRGRLDEVGDQVSRWSRDLEERDRKLAERISGL